MRHRLTALILVTGSLFCMLRSVSSRLRFVALLRSASAMLMTPSQSASASQFVVCIDGAAAPSGLTSKEFLLSSPSGAYTTARTCSRARRLFEWETHVARTATSVEAMVLGEKQTRETAPPAASALLDALATPAALRPRLDVTVASAMRTYVAAHGDDTELKVTVLVSWDKAHETEQCAESSSPPGSIACHIAPLPPLPTSPVRVEVRGAPRSNALAKDSAWVADRAPLEALMGASTAGPLNELLLVSEAGELLEGSQTNFFALVDGCVVTAGEGVLAGTVRRLLFEVCEREGIPVKLAPPNLADATQWEGALISSTSRLMLPIEELYVPAEGSPATTSDLRVKFDNAPGSLAARLRDLVASEVVQHSTEMI